MIFMEFNKNILEMVLMMTGSRHRNECQSAWERRPNSIYLLPMCEGISQVVKLSGAGITVKYVEDAGLDKQTFQLPYSAIKDCTEYRTSHGSGIRLHDEFGNVFNVLTAWNGEKLMLAPDGQETAKEGAAHDNCGTETSGRIDIYTDGGCTPNPGKGGWAYIMLEEGRESRAKSGTSKSTTSTEMELIAAVRALEAVKNRKARVTLYSDSSYLVSGMERGKIGKKRKYESLWKHLFALREAFDDLTFVWIKGHSGNQYNEKCDWMAKKAMRYEKNAG